MGFWNRINLIGMAMIAAGFVCVLVVISDLPGSARDGWGWPMIYAFAALSVTGAIVFLLGTFFFHNQDERST